MNDQYRIVCRNQEDEEIFTIQDYETEHEAQTMAQVLNAVSASWNRWTVEPLVFN
jgi:hypothetical protein